MLSFLKSVVIPAVVALVVSLGVVHSTKAADYTQLRQATYKIYNDFGGNGTGVMIAPNRMLTAAHVAIFENGDSKLYVGPDKKRLTVLMMDEKIDIALISVDIDCPCVPIGTIAPRQDSEVITVGYPIGDIVKLQILTEGRVQGYLSDESRMLSTVNGIPGNSGGGMFQLVDNHWVIVGVLVENLSYSRDGLFPITVFYITRAVDLDSVVNFLKRSE